MHNRLVLPAANRPGMLAKPAPAPGKRRSGHMILLVDDEPCVRQLSRRVLERRGYQVIDASSGRQALRIFSDVADDIVLLVTDVVMPGMSGLELVAQMQSMRPALPVLFTSGYSQETVLPAPPVHGAVAFLEKPFAPDMLILKVEELLEDVVTAQ